MPCCLLINIAFPLFLLARESINSAMLEATEDTIAGRTSEKSYRFTYAVVVINRIYYTASTRTVYKLGCDIGLTERVQRKNGKNGEEYSFHAFITCNILRL